MRPFLWLSGSAQGSRTVGRVRYHGRTTTRGFKSNREVTAAFVTTRVACVAGVIGEGEGKRGSPFLDYAGHAGYYTCEWLDLLFFVFLRTINLRSGLTILSSLDSVGC